jgi:hypothetical protein
MAIGYLPVDFSHTICPSHCCDPLIPDHDFSDYVSLTAKHFCSHFPAPLNVALASFLEKLLWLNFVLSQSQYWPGTQPPGPKDGGLTFFWRSMWIVYIGASQNKNKSRFTSCYKTYKGRGMCSLSCSWQGKQELLILA